MKKYCISIPICFLSFTVQAAVDPQEMLEKQWIEVRSPNFHIITDAKEKVGLKMAQDLENFGFSPQGCSRSILWRVWRRSRVSVRLP